MNNCTYKFLYLSNFKDIPNWSVQYAEEENLGFTKKYPMARIGSFLAKSQDTIFVQDDVAYKQVTIKINNGGVVPRNNGATLKGNKIGTKRQKIVHTGQFIMSKIDARNGAYGIVPDELDGAIVTNDFPVFDVDDSKILPQFLVLVSTTDRFIEFARKCSSGTTNRKRIDIETFLQQKIPLPSIQEQIGIVNQYSSLNQLAEQHENTAKEKEQLCLQYWVDRLGIDISSKEKIAVQGLSFTNLKSVSQWGVDFIVKKAKQDRFSLFFKCCKIKDICKIGSGGTPSRGRKEYYCGTIPWIKTGELRNNIIYDTEEKITKEAVLNSSAKLYPQGCLVMAMYGATIGKTAKLGIDATTNQACAVLYDIDTSLVNLNFLWYYLQTQTDKFKELAYGGAQPNINAGIVSEYLLPLPPLVVQEEMVSYTTQVLKDIDHLKKESLLYRNQSLDIVNQVLFDVSCSE